MSTRAIVRGSVLVVAGCGGATRARSPQAPEGKVELTAARVASHVERVLVAEHGAISMVGRNGCVATLASGGSDETDAPEEMRIRCPKPERIKAWFEGVDRITPGIAVEPATDDGADDDVILPAAELVTRGGDVMLVAKRADAERLLHEVRALSAELASVEMPRPGPKSANGWELLRVTGPAHVFLGGSPTSGLLDARMSTNGQYLCEFVASTREGPMRATKSGWITPSLAANAIDEVLSPLADASSAEHRGVTSASGTASGAEHRANAASTAAVIQRFAHVQDALGDACLPELDAPSASVGL
jgi:hypothetical protein